jgi:hypothetical protein
MSITSMTQVDELFLIQHHLKPDKRPYIDPESLILPETIKRVVNALSINTLIEEASSSWKQTGVSENLEDMSGRWVDHKTYMDYIHKVTIHNEIYVRRELILAYIAYAVEKTQPEWKTSWITVDWLEVISFLEKLTGLNRPVYGWDDAVSLNHSYICWRLYSPLYPGMALPWEDVSFTSVESFIADMPHSEVLKLWKLKLARQTEQAPTRLRNSSEPYIRMSMNMSELRDYLFLSRDYRTKAAFLSKACRTQKFDDPVSRWTHSWNFEPRLLGVIAAFLPIDRKTLCPNPIFPIRLTDLEPDTYVVADDDSDISDDDDAKSPPPTMRFSSDDVLFTIDEIVRGAQSYTDYRFEHFFLKWCAMKYAKAYYDPEGGLVSPTEIETRPASFKNNIQRYHLGDFWEDPISKFGRITYFFGGEEDFVELSDNTHSPEEDLSPLLVDFYGPLSVMGPFMEYYKKLGRPDYRLDSLYTSVYPNYEEMITACHTSSPNTPRFSHECFCKEECTCAYDPLEWVEVYPSG